MATIARYLMAYKYAGTTPSLIGYWDKTYELGREPLSTSSST